MYVLCVYYVASLFLSSLIILLGYHYGYIRQENAQFEGVLGWLIWTFLDFMADFYLPWTILLYEATFTVTGAVLIFVLAGFTNSLPRRMKEEEQFGVVFPRHNVNHKERSVEDYLSKAGKQAFWFSALFLVKSLTSLSAVSLSVGMFSVWYSWGIYDHYVYSFWFGGVSMIIFSNAAAILSVVMAILIVISGDRIFLGDDAWIRWTSPLSLKLKDCVSGLPPCLSKRLNRIFGRWISSYDLITRKMTPSGDETKR